MDFRHIVLCKGLKNMNVSEPSRIFLVIVTQSYVCLPFECGQMYVWNTVVCDEMPFQSQWEFSMSCHLPQHSGCHIWDGYSCSFPTSLCTACISAVKSKYWPSVCCWNTLIIHNCCSSRPHLGGNRFDNSSLHRLPPFQTHITSLAANCIKAHEMSIVRSKISF